MEPVTFSLGSGARRTRPHREVKVTLVRLVPPLVLVAVLSVPVGAEVLPPEPRDGCVTGMIPAYSPPTDIDLFTVPDGMRFVLTEIQIEAGSPTLASLIDDLGTPRWIRLGTDGTRSWVTGITFGPNRIVRIQFGHHPYDRVYTICWTGYLRPLPPPPTSVTGGKDQVGLNLRVGPNPGTGSTTLWFRLDRPGPFKLAIYDPQGRLVRTLRSGQTAVGDQAVRWDGRDRNGKDVEAGLFFARLETSGGRRSAKIVRVE